MTMSPGHCTHPNPHDFSSEIGTPESKMMSHEVMQKELGIEISQNSQARTNPPTSATQFAYLGPSVISALDLPSEPMAILCTLERRRKYTMLRRMHWMMLLLASQPLCFL
ncbi:hypothetical protein Nepgr_019613 [Nepenthes gracilis]|uniref:Uncharacterized protein n=1 Tax=Nepenthes gracilis TaxID=150966 RepID=A0AAD3XUA6_NEPGR|nr:hypothetical protein Nepgr_019613 [Nepenthes gracilis]